MNLFRQIRKNRAKRHLKKALKIIGEFSWEELDEMFPKPDCTKTFEFCHTDLSNVKFKYPFVPTEKGGAK
jgi:hypothetical protein